jgi:hypothetical protein
MQVNCSGLAKVDPNAKNVFQQNILQHHGTSLPVADDNKHWEAVVVATINV